MATLPKEEEERQNRTTLIEKINFMFEDGTHSIGDIIFKFPLPVVGVCDTTKCAVPVEKTSLTVDLRQPLLFYRKRNIQKVPARSLFFNEATTKFEEVGDPLLIPEDYKGYFAILTRRGVSNLSDDNAPHFSKIEEIAASDTTQFLIGGQNRVQGYLVVGRKGENVTQQERKLFPGDVLIKGKILVCETKVKKGLLRRNSIISEKYLSCTDDAERQIIIPFSESGFFYALSSTSGKVGGSVMQMSDIVAQKCLPCVAKLVYGRVPNTPCSFSGLLKLDKAHLEQSVIASTIMNLKNILIEIPSVCDMTFRIAMSNRELLSHKGYSNAMELCGEKIFTYMRNMKVCHRVSQDAIDDQLARPMSEEDVSVSSRIMQTSRPLACSKHTQRDSGYIPMSPTSPCADGMSDGKDYVRMVNPESAESLPPQCSQRQLLKLYVKNNLMEIPVYDQQSLTSASDQGTITDVTDDQPPTPNVDAPPPCMGPTPKPCSGSPSQDSGVSDDGMMMAMPRRPSTFIFAESDQNKDDDIIYDIPIIPTSRRVSAPPNFDSLPDDMKPKGAPRLHRSATFTSSMQKKVQSCTTKDVCPTETIHEHHEGCEHDEAPHYENIEGLKDIKATLERHQTLAESDQVCFPWHQSASDIYLQRLSYGSSQASGETSTSNSGPTTPAVTSSRIEDCDKFDNLVKPPPQCETLDILKENPSSHMVCTDTSNYTLPTSLGPSRSSSETKCGGLNDGKTEMLSELGTFYDDATDDEEIPPAPHIVKKDGYSEILPSPHNVDSDGYDIMFTQEDEVPYLEVVSDSVKDMLEEPCDVFLDSGEEIPMIPSVKPYHRLNTSHTDTKTIPPIPQRKPSDGKQNIAASVTDDSSTSSSNAKLKRREHLDSYTKSLNVDELDKALKECGVKPQSRDHIREHVSFDKLLDMNADDLSEDLPGIGLTDRMKISMFIRSWRLQRLTKCCE